MIGRVVRGVTLALALALAGCGDSGPESGPAPRPLGDAPATRSAPSPSEQARTLASNPRLLLFDLQTALEGVRETRGSYPPVDELQGTESWALQRAALDAAFSEWEYESDGESYRLSGEVGGRTFEIHGP